MSKTRKVNFADGYTSATIPTDTLPTGPKGDKGDQGAIGIISNYGDPTTLSVVADDIDQHYVDLLDGKLYKWNGTNWDDTGLVTKGDPGTAGPQGPLGPMGPKGIQGPIGPQGDTTTLPDDLNQALKLTDFYRNPVNGYTWQLNKLLFGATSADSSANEYTYAHNYISGGLVYLRNSSGWKLKSFSPSAEISVGSRGDICGGRNGHIVYANLATSGDTEIAVYNLNSSLSAVTDNITKGSLTRVQGTKSMCFSPNAKFFVLGGRRNGGTHVPMAFFEVDNDYTNKTSVSTQITTVNSGDYESYGEFSPDGSLFAYVEIATGNTIVRMYKVNWASPSAPVFTLLSNNNGTAPDFTASTSVGIFFDRTANFFYLSGTSNIYSGARICFAEAIPSANTWSFVATSTVAGNIVANNGTGYMAIVDTGATTVSVIRCLASLDNPYTNFDSRISSGVNLNISGTGVSGGFSKIAIAPNCSTTGSFFSSTYNLINTTVYNPLRYLFN